jgi:hypothetical protein
LNGTHHAGRPVSSTRATRVFFRAYRLAKSLAPRRRTGFDVVTYERFADVPAADLDALTRAYVEVFAEPPWRIVVPDSMPARKLAADLEPVPAWLTLLREPDAGVGGFCWGAVVPSSEVPARIVGSSALTDADQPRLAEALHRLGAARVAFADEIAILRRARGTTRSVDAFVALGTPLLELAARERVGILCWTLPGSAAARILNRGFQFQVVEEVGSVSLLWAAPGVAKDLAVLAPRLDPRSIRRGMRWTGRHQRG